MPDDIATMANTTSGLAAGHKKPIAQAAAETQQALGTHDHEVSQRFQELSQFYQSMLSKGTERMTGAIDRLSRVKTPVEFMAVQQSVFKEALEATRANYQELMRLNLAVCSAAFQPMRMKAA